MDDRLAKSQSESERARVQARWMMELWRQVRMLAAVAVLAPLLGGTVLVAQAYYLSKILHAAIVEGMPRETMLPAVVLIAGLIALRAAVAFGGEVAGARAAEAIKFRLREALFARLLAEDPSWSASRASGALASMMVDQIEVIEGFLARYMPAMVAAAVLPLAFAVVAMPFEPVIGLLFLVTAPLIPVFMALVGWGAEAASRNHVQAFARLSGLFGDRLRGIVTLKLFGCAEAEADKVEAASDELRRRTLGVLKVAFLSSAVLEFFAALGVAGVALYVGLTYLGLIDLRTTPLTLQAGLFCLLMAPEVYFPLRQLAIHYHDRAAAKAAIAELDTLFGNLPEIGPGRSGKMAAASVEGPAFVPVSVVGLTLHTPDSARIVLDHAEFGAKPGEHIAILGESGIGKSSFLEALARLRAYDGDIHLGVRLLQEISEDELRRRVAFLGQRPRLFQGSIAHNIRLGRMSATDDEVRIAADRAGVLAFASRLDDGLESIIGEDGAGLSGGEAHRVALARIFLRDPELFLLDEPTAHLDAATEDTVLQSIREFAQGRTLIVATHSLRVASAMDCIMRIDDGRIVPTGRVSAKRIPERDAA
ncbi:thiol reductant ABC exporter subunit CydD [Microvirga sp. 2TAF3]|uniref:thiol reductant ABC exporter subunit CydD n=1 Tax=Microvirga sp. 2TAF3 TaxID=3233014 RepID=UPI003F9665AA